MIRRWAGTILLSIMSIGLGTAGQIDGWPFWVTAAVIAVTMLGAILTFPRTRFIGSAVPGTTLIRGDASGSTFDTVVLNGVETMVDGDARQALFRDIRVDVGRPTKRPR